MRRGGFLGRAVLVAAAVALLPACGDHSSSSHLGTVSPPPPEPPVANDFILLDVNSTSPTYDTYVSPRDYLGMVPAFYFGHAET